MIRLLFAATGLAIGFALPTFAQQKEEANPFFYRAIPACWAASRVCEQ